MMLRDILPALRDATTGTYFHTIEQWRCEDVINDLMKTEISFPFLAPVKVHLMVIK
jgi:hypothetical protein